MNNAIPKMTVILVPILSAGIKQSINLITININEDNHIIYNNIIIAVFTLISGRIP